MAQEVRWRGRATKVYVFNQQISTDDCFSVRVTAKYSRIVSDTGDGGLR